MNKLNILAVEIGKFMNQEIIIRNTDYYAFGLPYFSTHPNSAYFRGFVYVLLQKTTWKQM